MRRRGRTPSSALTIGSLLSTCSPRTPSPRRSRGSRSVGKVQYRQDGALPTSAVIYHSLSPLDVALRPTCVWPEAAARPGIVRSAMVYDLIPANDPEVELIDPVVRRQYRLALEAVRHLDTVQTLSSSVADDLARADVAPGRGVIVIGAAPEERFVPPIDRAATATAIAAALGCPSRYVYVPTGSHPRKNNERVVAAFASLPESVRGRPRAPPLGDDRRAHADPLPSDRSRSRGRGLRHRRGVPHR